MNKCPKCGQVSLTKRPGGVMVREFFGSQNVISNEYSIVCMNPECKHIVDTYVVKTEFGEKLEKPWYKRIF